MYKNFIKIISRDSVVGNGSGVSWGCSAGVAVPERAAYEDGQGAFLLKIDNALVPSYKIRNLTCGASAIDD